MFRSFIEQRSVAGKSPIAVGECAPRTVERGEIVIGWSGCGRELRARVGEATWIDESGEPRVQRRHDSVFSYVDVARVLDGVG